MTTINIGSWNSCGRVRTSTINRGILPIALAGKGDAMKMEEKYNQKNDECVECVLPIEMSATLAASKGIEGRTEVRLNEKEPSKSRTVTARTVEVTLDWTGVSTKELVWLATKHWTANMGKQLMWHAEHTDGNVDLGTIQMREFLDTVRVSARGTASKDVAELRKAKAQIEKDAGVSLAELVALLAAGKVKIER